MIQTPSRSFLTLVFGASICSFVIELAVAEEPRRNDIEQAIKALSDDSYRNRHDAYRALIAGGEFSIELLQRAARTPSLEVAQRSVEALVDIAERTTSDSDDEHRDRLRASMIEMLERIAEDPKALVAGAATQEAKWLRMESLRATSDGPTRCSFTCKWIPPRAFPTYGEANTQKLRS